MAEFRAKQLHQKAEIGRIDILATRDKRGAGRRHRPAHPQRHLPGQGVHRGVSRSRSWLRPWFATLNMALNGRFPTAVGDFKYEINR